MTDFTAIDRRARRHRTSPAATFRALDAGVGTRRRATSCSPCWCTTRALRQSERFYSNKPAEYPVGGRKPVTDSAWMQTIIGRGEPYIGRTREDIREVFYDYELIWSLGCESVLNVPVRWRGQTVGTLNLLHRAGVSTMNRHVEARSATGGASGVAGAADDRADVKVGRCPSVPRQRTGVLVDSSNL